ncbi:ABC transporter ATP-binding protein [Actinotalea sp. M2MS4P-6]|uniref:ABC transporter ATP-binding protein n=1 Tax=Actinotalea sp. M2MS4P-6 TaxID=2983762 RepID=UPI0021E48F43|nr:ABC transporter ATP-binding protein [Actinotalea sp. M2MS4P-6]MCV2393843.1 ABC transporter ATP-binding protein [Actinotalea sp. M2MS4P-6]
MIELRYVRKVYGTLTVLDGLTAAFPEGSVTALLGANGSGKTTVGRLLLGLERPTAGEVSGVDGRPRAAVFQQNRLCEQLSAVDNVRLAAHGSVDRGEVVDALRGVGLAGESLAQPVRQLSGGQRRRVAVVRGLVAPAELVVLDEPFTGLDTEARRRTMGWVRDRLAGRTAVLITHHDDEVAWFDAGVLRLPGPGA